MSEDEKGQMVWGGGGGFLKRGAGGSARLLRVVTGAPWFGRDTPPIIVLCLEDLTTRVLRAHFGARVDEAIFPAENSREEDATGGNAKVIKNANERNGTIANGWGCEEAQGGSPWLAHLSARTESFSCTRSRVTGRPKS